MPTSTPHDDRAEFAADQAAAPVRLRPLTEDDLDPLVVLQREGAVRSLSHVFVQRDHPFPSDEIRAQWATEIADPGIDCFAAVRGDELVGFVATKGTELLHFGTAVHTWGTGVAGRVHDLTLDHLRDGGHERAWLKVLTDNSRAIRFYTRRGWSETGAIGHSEFPPYPVVDHLERNLTDGSNLR